MIIKIDGDDQMDISLLNKFIEPIINEADFTKEIGSLNSQIFQRCHFQGKLEIYYFLSLIDFHQVIGICLIPQMGICV